jgi:hypothetical protein
MANIGSGNPNTGRGRVSISGVNTGGSGVVAPGLLSLSSIFGAGDDGFALDFTRTSNSTETTMYQDSSFTTPVTTTGDLVGGVRDESGNNNDFTQATAANKPDWTEGQGIKALDAGDLMTATFGATISTYTASIRAKDPGNTGGTVEYMFRAEPGANNRTRIYKLNEAIDCIARIGGNTTTIQPITGLSDGSVNTIAYYHNDTTNGVWGQFNNNAAVTGSRSGTASWGTTLEICNTHTTPIHRIIWIDRQLTPTEIEQAKLMVKNGWSS